MKLIRYEGENVTPSDDAILYRQFLSDGLFATVTPTFTSGAITIPAMRGVICGRDFTTDIETLTAVLASSGTITGQIYMWIDMEDETYPLSIKIRNSVGSLSDDDINNGGQYYGLEIAQYTANTSAVTGVTLTVGFVQQELDVHKAERVSQSILITRDLSLVGVQTVSILTGRKVKSMVFTGAVDLTKKMMVGQYGESAGGSIYSHGDTGNYSSAGYPLAFSDLGATNRTFGTVQNVVDGSFDINWTKTGTGATGTAGIRTLVLYHD